MKKISLQLLPLLFALALCGQNTNEDLEQAQQLLKTYRYAEAVDLLEQLIQTGPENLDLKMSLAEAYEKSGRQSGAMALYKQVLKADSTHVETLLLLGKLSSKMEDNGLAYTCFATLCNLHPENPHFHKLAGAIARQDPLKIGSAITHYQKALNLNPGDEEAGQALAGVYLDLQQFATARGITQSFLKKDSANKALVILDTRIAYLQKNYGHVIKNAAYLLGNGDTVISVTRLYGVSLYHLEKYDQALAWLNYLLPDHKSEQVYFFISMAHYRKQEYQRAQNFMELAIKETESPSLGSFYTQLAMVYEVRERYRDAIDAYKEAYELTGNENLLYRLARVTDEYYKDDKVAENYYQKFLEKSDTTVSLQRGYSEQRLSEIRKVRFFKKDTI